MTTETKVTHTPGPWRVTSDTNRELPNMIVSEEKGTVAHLVSFVKYRQADAAVIAAAPDMLEALEQLCSLLEAQGQELSEAGIAYVAEYNHAKEVIAKAKGGAA